MSSESVDYTDSDVLKSLYHDKGMTIRDVAEFCDTTPGKVRYQMDKHEIQTRQYHEPDDAIYKDEETLRRLYWREDHSIQDIAAKAEVNRSTVHKWMQKLGVERRTAYNEREYVTLKLDDDGYMVWRHYDGETYNRVGVHRLIAVAEYGFDAVSGMDVHHNTDIPFDNRPGNLELLTHEEHAKHHGIQNAEQQRELMNALRSEGRL